MVMIILLFFTNSGQLFDGFDDEYQCPILDEDRVSTRTHTSNGEEIRSSETQRFWLLWPPLTLAFFSTRLWMNWRTR